MPPEAWPIALVSGASGGIGRAIVARLLAEGSCVGLLARREDALKALVDDLAPRYGAERLLVLPAAVEETHQVQDAMDRLHAHWARLDLLVCAHGAAPVIRPTLEVTADDWRDVVTPDLWGTVTLCQAAARLMLPQRTGSIVLLSSIHARMTYPQRAVYAMAKAGILGLMRALAVEWGPSQIRVNAISPWQTAGPRTQAFIERERQDTGADLLALYHQKAPLQHLVWPDDLADLVVSVARNTSLTGQNLVVDCGVSASAWYKEW